MDMKTADVVPARTWMVFAPVCTLRQAQAGAHRHCRPTVALCEKSIFLQCSP
eukprot:m.1431372 g.1431372  ORF g.1431372 m.1431372 type:complete len:52 (-) comp25075_c0_seq31:1459-1614(-)